MARRLLAAGLMALALGGTRAATADEPKPPERLCWRLVKTDTFLEHPEEIYGGVRPWREVHDVTSLSGGGIRITPKDEPSQVLEVWPAERRALRTQGGSSIEFRWTAPPALWCSDQDVDFNITAVAKGSEYLWYVASYDTQPTSRLVVSPTRFEPALRPGESEAVFRQEAGGIGATAGGGAKWNSRMSGTSSARPAMPIAPWPRVLASRDPWLLGLWFVGGAGGGIVSFGIHWHYELVPPGEVPPKGEDGPPTDDPKPPNVQCEKTLAKTWDTDWGRMAIRVEGGRATGEYANRSGRFGRGTFEGTLTAPNVIEARWSDANGKGTLRIVLSDDGCTFDGSHTVEPDTPPKQGPDGQDPGDDGVDPGDPGPAKPGDCLDPTVQACIDEWLRLLVDIRNRNDTSPSAPGGPWRIDRYGHLVGHAVVGGSAPDEWTTKYSSSKHCFVWDAMRNEHRDRMYAGELPPLASFVDECVRGKGKSTTTPATGAGMTIEADKRTVEVGGLVSVPVWLRNGRDVANTNLTVSYDPSVVRLEGEVMRGNLLDGALFSANATQVAIVRMGLAQTTGLSGTGTLAYLPFRAVGKAGAVSELKVAVARIDDPAGRPLTVATIDGSVRIVGPGDEAGDCNGDGRMTEVDALCALEMSVLLRPPRTAMDMDGDGEVTSRDAVLILQRAVGLATGGAR